ncbi:hypothetical protein ACUOH8_22570, partial [Escherichia coli]
PDALSIAQLKRVLHLFGDYADPVNAQRGREFAPAFEIIVGAVLAAVDLPGIIISLNRFGIISLTKVSPALEYLAQLRAARYLGLSSRLEAAAA